MGDVMIRTKREKMVSNILLNIIDRPSSFECLYSNATSGQSVCVLYTTSSRKYHSAICKNLVFDNLTVSMISCSNDEDTDPTARVV